MKRATGCFCRSKKEFDECCGPFLAGHALPGTPEQLMRSRYAAFCTQNVEYLVDTRHPSRRQPDDRETLVRTCRDTQWMGLKILGSSTEGHTGWVEFAAFYQQSGRTGHLHENSKFIQENGRWFYVDGDILPPLKFGRNEPCWCNSGKKYKKCHGKGQV